MRAHCWVNAMQYRRCTFIKCVLAGKTVSPCQAAWHGMAWQPWTGQEKNTRVKVIEIHHGDLSREGKEQDHVVCPHDMAQPGPTWQQGVITVTGDGLLIYGLVVKPNTILGGTNRKRRLTVGNHFCVRCEAIVTLYAGFSCYGLSCFPEFFKDGALERGSEELCDPAMATPTRFCSLSVSES